MVQNSQDRTLHSEPSLSHPFLSSVSFLGGTVLLDSFVSLQIDFIYTCSERTEYTYLERTAWWAADKLPSVANSYSVVAGAWSCPPWGVFSSNAKAWLWEAVYLINDVWYKQGIQCLTLCTVFDIPELLKGWTKQKDNNNNKDPRVYDPCHKMVKI